MLKKRTDIQEKDTWDIKSFYPDFESWEQDFKFATETSETPYWPSLINLQGTLSEGIDKLVETFEITLRIERRLEKLYTYAHLRHDEDTTNDLYKTAFERISSLLHTFHTASSWIHPELLSLSEEQITSYLNAPQIIDYRFHLEKIIRMKPHTLSKNTEKLLALAAKPLSGYQQIFSSMDDADFDFPSFRDGYGEERELTHALYSQYMRSPDRILRERACKLLHQHYASFENTLSSNLSGQVETQIFYAKARHYKSALEAALFPDAVETTVYETLIDTVRNNIDALHEYTQVRKDILSLGDLHYYDLYVPLVKSCSIEMSYEEAADCVIESVRVLGSDYQKALAQGLKEQRWVDRYENLHKRSGAYSSGCYDSHPYILHNYTGTLNDIYTLAHEAGHSMHSYLTWKTQPFHYSQYSIFVAEVASTFNENLLTNYLLHYYQDDEQKRAYIINQQLEEIRGTLFRQTMFAEFELRIHQLAEANEPLTPKRLRTLYRELVAFYYGDALNIDKEIDWEWARIPHFYYNFYVYQYATGISAAHALCKGVSEGGSAEKAAYLNFLKAGSSAKPLDLLRIAGVDMTGPTAVQATIDKFRSLLKDFN
ncbi:MAG: oligoendopeptidase F [Waddliaceae bacterium]|nr:oligoendopeptidase F [Waddliaceae bacterium]